MAKEDFAKLGLGNDAAANIQRTAPPPRKETTGFIAGTALRPRWHRRLPEQENNPKDSS